MAEVRKIGATDLSYKDYTSPAGKVVKVVEPVDVREFGAIPNAGAAVDEWSYFDTAIKYCNDNYKALYVPSGRYYVSAALDLSSNNTVRSFYTIKMFSDNWDHRDVGGSAVISPMSTFAGGTALVPTHLVIIDDGRGVIIDGISFRGNYASDSKYICAIGLKNYNSQTIINRVSIHDFYGGIHLAYGGDSNNDVNTLSNLNISDVDYGIFNSGTQTFGSQVIGVWRYARDHRMAWPLARLIILGTLPGVVAGFYLRTLALPDAARFEIFVGAVMLYLAWRLLYEFAPWAKRKQATGTGDLEEAVFAALGRRPMTAGDGSVSLGRHRDEILKTLASLLARQRVRRVAHGEKTFYARAHS